MALIRLRGCAGWSAPLVFACDKVRFSHGRVHEIFICLHDPQSYTLTIRVQLFSGARGLYLCLGFQPHPTLLADALSIKYTQQKS